MIANNDNELVITDLQSCAKLPAASECDAFITYPVDELTSSPTITPDNRIIAGASTEGFYGIDVKRGTDGQLEATEAWRYELPGMQFLGWDERGFLPLKIYTVTAVITAYENVFIAGYSVLNARNYDWKDINPIMPFVGDTETTMIAIDIKTGKEVFSIPNAGHLHTAAMAPDLKTLITTEYNFVPDLFGERGKDSGVRGWIAVD